MIPQSIAYAGLAGLAPQYGLYTAFIGSFTYIFLGTVKQVSIGPTSLMALLTFSYVHGKPIEFVVLLTFLAGCIELAMGILKLGFLVNFISPCLTSGFTSASAIIIIVAQLKALLGLKFPAHDTFSVLIGIFKNIHNIRWPDACLGLFCMVFLYCFKQITRIPVNSLWSKKALWFLSISKNALIVLLASILGFILHEHYDGAPFRLTGPVPQGLPHVKLPAFSVFSKQSNETLDFFDMVEELGSGIVVLPVVAVLANVAIAKSFSPDIVDATQEMMTLGLCNIFGSFVQAMPSCGAFTRSAVANSSGVRTPLQGIYSGTIIILALSFLASYFFYIPKATLAAVLIVAGSSLIDYEIFPVLWKCNKYDFFLTLTTLIVGVVFSVEWSIIIGVVLNLLILLQLWTRPKINDEIRSTNNNQFYLYIQPRLGLFYPATDYFVEKIRKAHNSHKDLPIVVDCTYILDIDYAAIKALQELINTYNKKNVQLMFANVNIKIFQALQTVIDTENLHLCSSTEDLCDKTFNNEQEKVLDVKIPLLNRRKMSDYENV